MNAAATAATLERVLGAMNPIDGAGAVIAALGQLVGTGVLELPLPAGGDTGTRLHALAEIAAAELSLARLAEGHADAVAILAEAGRTASRGLYGVWAADAPDARVEATRSRDGWVLRGRKRYASGATGLGRALVTAHAADGGRLFDVDLGDGRVRPLLGTWHAVGMAATESLDVAFDGVTVAENAAVGGPGFYLTRPGFWHGAVGVAACWYGGALGAFRMLRAHLGRGAPSEHQLAHLGAIAASCTMMGDALATAARAIDKSKGGPDEGGRTRALTVRHLVEQGCQEVLARVGRASGSSPLAFDRAHARRAADLLVYLRQHHAERDLAALGQAVLQERG